MYLVLFDTLQADLGVSDKEGRTALHYAITTKSVPCVQTITETRVINCTAVESTSVCTMWQCCIHPRYKIAILSAPVYPSVKY